jgi:hypothetical protein
MKLPAQWRLRLADLGIVAGAWALVSGVWFPPPLGWVPYALLVLCWALGLNLSRTYRGDGSLSEVAGKLALDHLLVTAVWIGILRFCGIHLDLMEILVFAGLALVGLALARVVLRQGRSGGTPKPSLVLGETLGAFIAFYALDGLWWNLRVPPLLWATLILSRLVVPWVLRLHLRPEPGTVKKAWLTWFLSQGLCTGLVVAIGAGSAWPQTSEQLLVGAGVLPLVVGGLYRAFRLHRPPTGDEAESTRRVTLGAMAFAVIHPYFSANLAGTGDAKMYAEAMQDYLGQLKAGIFPVFVSQTDIAPYGSVFPFRMASYHFYFGALLDRLTAGTLNVYAVQHLTLILSAFAGVFAMYAALTALAPERRWESVALIFLYLTCPGWLAGLYGKDMYFTYMTLPWLPLVLYTTVQTFRRGDLKDYAVLGGALALTWLAHPPVGFWASFAAAASQVVRLILQRPDRRDFARYGVAALTFGVLGVGLFVSLYDARVTGESMDASGVILASLRGAMPQALLPVSASGDRLGDFQIGYGLLALLFLAVFRRGTRPAPEQLALAAVAIFLLVVIYPIPGITLFLWHTMPRAVSLISNVWPMQRIYPVLAAIIPLAALPALSALGARARALTLSLLCAWSGWEAATFVRRGYLITHTAEATRLASRLENSPLLPNWTAYMAQLPDLPLLSRVNDPRLLNRLLAADGKTELISNFRVAAAPAASPTDPAVDAVPLQPGVMLLSPHLLLLPGQRYQLTLHFAEGDPAGLFQLLTLKDANFRYYQEIPLAPADMRKPLTLTVWTTGSEVLPLALLYHPLDPAYAGEAHPRFLSYHTQPYQDEALPIRVTSLAPYAAVVDAAQSGYLETHRFYIRGYRATVNGRAVPLTESPEHLAMLPIERGPNDVHLDYPGPAPVRAAYWFSLAAWVAVAAWGLWRLGRRMAARFRLSPGT